MRSFRSLFILILFCVGTLHAVVGDWVSFGSQLTLNDLHLSGNILRSSSHGGMVVFNMNDETFSTENNTDFLEHIDILRYYVSPDGSEWFSYASGVSGISYHTPEGYSDYFDYDFVEANAFTGNEDQVLTVYMNDFIPEIAHFVKNNNRYVFQDTYNQFPEDPEHIYDITLVGDSIYLATDKGLIRSFSFV